MFLMIENKGVANPNDLTLLGGSSGYKLIGKFGTGFMHGVLTCMRAECVPIVITGNLRMEFGIEMVSGRDTDHPRIAIRYNGKTEDGATKKCTEQKDYTLNHGIHDWRNVNMAMREFVSNAIDETYRFTMLKAYKEKGEYGFSFDEFARKNHNEIFKSIDWKNEIKFEVIMDESKIRAKSGCTRVYIPANDEIMKFVANIDKWFLHFSEPESLEKKVLPKKDRNTVGNCAVIYREGVKVCEITGELPSLFDYNINDLPLDESRNVNDTTAKHFCERNFPDSNINEKTVYLKSLANENKYWEHSFDAWNFSIWNCQESWKKAFNNALGEDAILVENQDDANIAKEKGLNPIVTSYNIIAALSSAQKNKLTEDEKAGRNIKHISYEEWEKTNIEAIKSDVEKTFEYFLMQSMFTTWEKLKKWKMVRTKTMPELYVYTGRNELPCFFRDNGIYIYTSDVNFDAIACRETILHALGMYITDTQYKSREVVSFLLDFLKNLAW